MFLVCASGAILSFEDEITGVLNRKLIVESDAAVSVDDFHAAAQGQLSSGEWVARIYLPLGRVKVQGADGARFLYFHPADARFLGTGSELMSWVIKFHRNLLLSKPGRWITLVSACVVIVLLFSGLKLWWPNKLKTLPRRLSIKADGSRARFFFDLHRVAGAYLFLPLLLISLTGLNYSIVSDTYRHLIKSLAQSPPIPSVEPLPELGPERLSLDEALKRARLVFPEAVATSVDFTKDKDGPLKIRFRHPTQPGEFGQSNVVLNPETGRVLRALNAMELSWGQQWIYVWALPLHRGRAFGLAHQLVWLAVAIAGASLPLSGFYLWYSRRKRTSLERS